MIRKTVVFFHGQFVITLLYGGIMSHTALPIPAEELRSRADSIASRSAA